MRYRQSEFVGLQWFLTCGLVKVLFLSLAVNILFFNGLDLFPGASLNEFIVPTMCSD